MNFDYDKIAHSVVKIEAGNSAGSGFHFCEKNIIVTNAHVVRDAYANGCKIYAKIDDKQYELICKKIEEKNGNDFAILRALEAFPNDREVLTVASNPDYAIGTEVVYAGFPHGFDDLILQRAIIAGCYNNNCNKFYIDGPVNEGNSGGPIIRLSDNAIIGIISARRFIKGDLDKLISSVNAFKELAIQQSKNVSISFGGINYNVEMAKSLAGIANIFRNVVLCNANTGLGVGQKIENCLKTHKESINQ